MSQQSIDEILKMKDAFDAIDIDKNGKLDLDELSTFAESVGWDRVMARICFFIFDGVENDGITLDNFFKFIPFLKELDKNPMFLWHKIFGKLDSDKKGALNYDEFCIFGRVVGIADDEELKKEFESADTNQNGLIEFEELLSALGITK